MWCASTMCSNTRKIRSLSYVELMSCSRRRGLLIGVPNLAGLSTGFPPFRTLRTEPKARASSQRVDLGQSG